MTKVAAITPLDGRYARLTGELAEIFSESGLIRHRVKVEVEWLKFIITDLRLNGEQAQDLSALDDIVDGFSEADALRVKQIESTTNHDVKAVEYLIKEKLDAAGLGEIREWVHFACTSEDINNTSYGLMLNQGKAAVTQLLKEFVAALEEKAMAYKSVPMMSRTHGQPATPTTVGKELVNIAWRMNQEIVFLEDKKVQAKINGDNRKL